MCVHVYLFNLHVCRVKLFAKLLWCSGDHRYTTSTLCVNMCVCECVYICVYICACVCTCIYVCVITYAYVWISSSIVTYSHCTLSHMCGNPHILGGVEDCS